VNTAGATDDIVQVALHQVTTKYRDLGASDQVGKGVDLLALMNAELVSDFQYRQAHRDGPKNIGFCPSANSHEPRRRTRRPTIL
jgi:hypothetical protein